MTKLNNVQKLMSRNSSSFVSHFRFTCNIIDDHGVAGYTLNATSMPARTVSFSHTGIILRSACHAR